MKYIIAHDFGTSALKSAVYSTDGELLNCTSVDYPSFRTADGIVEQDPENWWQAFCSANRTLTDGIDKNEIACVSFDGVTAALVCCGHDGKALHRAIMWQDGRSAAEAKEILSMLTTPELKNGRNFMGPGRTCVQLYWVCRHHPEIIEKTEKVCLNNANFVVSRLIGKYVTDYEIGSSGALMYAERGKGWDMDFIRLLGIPERILPEAHWMEEIVGTVTSEMSEEVSLAAGTPVMLGGDDGRMVTLGTGVVNEGDSSITCGTSGGVTVLGANVGLPGTNAVGSTMEWLRRTLCSEEEAEAAASGRSVFDLMAETASRSSAGANGVLFIPYLGNERGIRRNTLTRGCFAGMSLGTIREDMVRAGIEGIILNLYGFVRRFRDAGCEVSSMTANGGLTKNAYIRQMMADIIGSEIVLVQNASYSGPTGCAMLASMAVGETSSLSEAAERFVRTESVTYPDRELHEFYKGIFKVWDALYGSQLEIYEKLAELRTSMQ